MLQLKTRTEKGLLPKDTDIEVRDTVSAIENFIKLNRLTPKPYKIVPMTTFKLPFFSFTENDLVSIFWENEILKQEILKMVGSAFSTRPNKSDVERWFQDKPSGYLITRLVTDVGRGYRGDGIPSKDYQGYRKSARVMELNQVQDHVNTIRREGFDPRAYDQSGYVLRSTIRTDGFRLQVLGFKMKELNCVKYRRLPETALPPRLTSTLGGTDYYLSEVRNVVRTEQDVVDLWDCAPEDIKILGLDLGQNCVVGAYASIPSAQGGEQTQFTNLAVKQRALYQPSFRFRHWLEASKNKVLDGGEMSISDMESMLPPLRGGDASVTQYVSEEQEFKGSLQTFYDDDHNTFKRHSWDARKAMDGEYDVLCHRLLQMVGGSGGEKRHPTNKVAIAIGLGKFSSNSKLPSLHSRFLSLFVQKVN